jgi:hypothetical protein
VCDGALTRRRESAYSIANRQATDSIPIVDDIRSALDRMFPTDDMEAAQNYENDDDWEDYDDEEDEQRAGDDDYDEADDDGEEEIKVRSKTKRNDGLQKDAARGDEEKDDDAGAETTTESNAAWTRYQYMVAAKNSKLELLDRLIEELGLSG